MLPCTTRVALVSESGAPFQLDDLDALFKGFADPTRIRLLNVLAAGELCVCGLVSATREWKFAHYRLAEPTNSVHGNLLSCVRSCFTGVPALDAERAAAVVRVQERLAVPC